MNLLEVRGLEVHYGGIRAVKGVDLVVAEGELVCLIGANGAGKTSTLKAICGLLPSHTGSVRYDGKEISRLPVYQLPRQGLVMVPEGRGIFPQLTVAENLAMGAYARRDADVARDLDRIQQMLAIGRALMSRPRMLLLDEPSMGLAPLMVAKILDTVREISRQGVTILLVEQNAKLALEIAARGYVMESGVLALGADAKSLLADPRVREAYLGEGAA
jgi:branched-chain amino acid transport system ATP-binding protein